MKEKRTDNRCPLCHAENNCMAHSKKNCWCNEVLVPQELLDLVPVANKRQACICRTCIESFNRDPEGFSAGIGR